MPYSYFDTGGIVFCVSILTISRSGTEASCCAAATDDTKQNITADAAIALIVVSCFGSLAIPNIILRLEFKSLKI